MSDPFSDDVSLRLLYGESTEIQELDPEEQIDRENDALEKYEVYMFTESIGTNVFEDYYYLFSNEVLNQEIEGLKTTLNRIIEKLNEVYDFSFSEEVELNISEERTWLFEFIKFLEFDNLEFLESLYDNFEIDFSNVKDVHEFLKDKSKYVIFTIQTMDMIYSYNKFIVDFLMNYNEESLIKWLSDQTENHKLELKIQNRRRKENGESNN